jgi:hypothetical protein
MQASLKENNMNQRKLALSIGLGAMLTLGLLVGFDLSSNTSMASAPVQVSPADNAQETLRAQDTVSTAYLAVRFADHDNIVRAITFTKPITAYAALERADLDVDVVETAFGLMLCGVDGVGESLPDGSACDNGTQYWGTSYWSDRAWVARMSGIGSTVISETGHVEGFSFSDPNWTPVNPPPAPSLTSAHKALNWLRDQQQPDGSFGSLNGTAEVLMAVGANRIEATTWHGEGPSLLANSLSEGPELANRNVSGVGKLAAALSAQESCWPIGAMRPSDYYDPVSGTFALDTLYQAWGMLGTSALSETIPPSATQYLKELQQPDGGWEWAIGQGTDTNSTALALQALIAAGEPATSSVITSGLNYLEDAQNEDGGFPYSPDSPWGTASDANSTAYVVQALLATGQNPLTGTWTVSNTNPVSYLLNLQLPNGAFEWQAGAGADPFATRQVIPALLHQPFPLQAAAVQDCYGVSGEVVSTQEASQHASLQATDKGLGDVTVWAQGASDLYFGTTVSPTGAYTLSVLTTGTYTLTPSRASYVFSPTERSVQVSGTPGDVTSVPAFVGETRIYLPLLMRN